MSFTVDGQEWPIEARFERLADLQESDISGRLLDGSLFRDVLGTFYRWQVTLTVPFDKTAEYAQLYEILTEPVDGHTFVLPYNSTTLTVTAAVKELRDLRYPTADGGSYWAGCTFAIEANHPSKFMSLDQVLARGGTPLPELSEGTEGDTWRYDGANGWVHESYPDGDASYW